MMVTRLSVFVPICCYFWSQTCCISFRVYQLNYSAWAAWFRFGEVSHFKHLSTVTTKSNVGIFCILCQANFYHSLFLFGMQFHAKSRSEVVLSYRIEVTCTLLKNLAPDTRTSFCVNSLMQVYVTCPTNIIIIITSKPQTGA